MAPLHSLLCFCCFFFYLVASFYLTSRIGFSRASLKNLARSDRPMHHSHSQRNVVRSGKQLVSRYRLNRWINNTRTNLRRLQLKPSSRSSDSSTKSKFRNNFSTNQRNPLQWKSGQNPQRSAQRRSKAPSRILRVPSNRNTATASLKSWWTHIN